MAKRKITNGKTIYQQNTAQKPKIEQHKLQ